jgi:WXXGXW repeat (2 copies)
MRITSIIATLLAMLFMAGETEKAQAGLFISITVAPPALPVYVQPPIPGPGYMWTPGYWAWDDDDNDYYWVPGAWVEAPEPGLLWTRLLGASYRFLWRRQLRIWLYRRGIRGWRMGRRRLLLQQGLHEHRRIGEYHERL